MLWHLSYLNVALFYENGTQICLVGRCNILSSLLFFFPFLVFEPIDSIDLFSTFSVQHAELLILKDTFYIVIS